MFLYPLSGQSIMVLEQKHLGSFIKIKDKICFYQTYINLQTDKIINTDNNCSFFILVYICEYVCIIKVFNLKQIQ